jgi:hypothetical protein
MSFKIEWAFALRLECAFFAVCRNGMCFGACFGCVFKMCVLPSFRNGMCFERALWMCVFLFVAMECVFGACFGGAFFRLFEMEWRFCSAFWMCVWMCVCRNGNGTGNGLVVPSSSHKREVAGSILAGCTKTFLFPLLLLPHQLMSYFDVWRHLSFHENQHMTS